MLAMNWEPLVFAFHADTLYTFEPAVREAPRALVVRRPRRSMDLSARGRSILLLRSGLGTFLRSASATLVRCR